MTVSIHPHGSVKASRAAVPVGALPHVGAPMGLFFPKGMRRGGEGTRDRRIALAAGRPGKAAQKPGRNSIDGFFPVASAMEGERAVIVVGECASPERPFETFAIGLSRPLATNFHHFLPAGGQAIGVARPASCLRPSQVEDGRKERRRGVTAGQGLVREGQGNE